MAQDTMAAPGQLDESTFLGEGAQGSPAEKVARLSCASSVAVGEMRKPGGAECKSHEDECKSRKAGHTPGEAACVPREADPEVAAAAERLATRRAYLAAKRAFDVAFSLLVLVLLCWLYALIAVAIKLDDPRGPVLFRQRRVGLGGREFTMYKFRSMRPDAEEHLAELESLNEKTGPVFKMRDDPRVTRVGRVLRKTSLDELPQFANVLAGDLSVVGPRPAIPREVETYDARQAQRLLVKPGITCLWQTQRDRDSISFDEWVDLDLRYVVECGPATDIRLIVKTVGVVLTAQGS